MIINKVLYLFFKYGIFVNKISSVKIQFYWTFLNRLLALIQLCSNPCFSGPCFAIELANEPIKACYESQSLF